MSNASPQRRVRLFVVRLWRETAGESGAEWRGRVQDVETGEARYFRDVAALVAFLSAALDISPAPDAPQASRSEPDWKP